MTTPHQQMQGNQAQGLQRLFSGHATKLVSVLAGPSAPDSHEIVLTLAAALSGRGQRVWLVDTGSGELARGLGCRPLLPWQASRPLEEQVISAGAYGLLYAPGCKAGDTAFASSASACRNCDYLLLDGGRFSQTEAPVDPATDQTLVIFLGSSDAEAGYSLLKALHGSDSPARVLLVGETAELVAQAARRFMNQNLEFLKTADGLCQIGNTNKETSSNTLTIEPNLTLVVSRIMQNDQPKVAHGGSGKGAEELD